MRGSLACFLLVAACSEPLIAVVGVEGDASRPEGGVGEHEPDADSPRDRDAETEAHVLAEHCLVLPELTTAGVAGESVGPEARTRGFTPNGINECPVGDGDAGQVTLYVFELLNREPIVRAGHRYAFSWPPEGKDPEPLLALSGSLSTASKPCEGGPLLAEVTRNTNSRDCVELKPKQDAPYLVLTTPVLIGWGNAEFQLCPGPCSP